MKILTIMNTWSIQVKNTYYLQTPDKASICGEDAELRYAYDHLLFQWTSVDAFFREITHFLTDFIFYDKEPVVNIILKNGLMAYRELLDLDDSALRPHDRVMRFFIVVISTAKIVCTFTVKDINSDETWNVLDDTPLTIWRFNRNNLLIEKNDLAELDIAKSIYQKTLPSNIKLAMRRHRHEDTILAGDLACHS